MAPRSTRGSAPETSRTYWTDPTRPRSSTSWSSWRAGEAPAEPACGSRSRADSMPQGQRRLLALAQRRRQVQAQPDQIAGQRELGHPAAQTDGRRIGGTAAGLLRQPRHDTEFARLAQGLGAGHALQSERHAQARARSTRGGGRCRHRAAVDPHVAAQQPALHGRDRETGLGEADAATRACQPRHLGRQLHIVARQVDAPLHGRALRSGQAAPAASAAGPPCHWPSHGPASGRSSVPAANR